MGLLYLLPDVTERQCVKYAWRSKNIIHHLDEMGTAIAQWLRCCATNRKVRSQLVSLEFFIGINSFRSHYGPGIDSVSNTNKYQEHFMGVKATGA